MKAKPRSRVFPRLTIAGLVIVRQRPGTAKGVVFMTLEDESGVANVIVWPTVFESFRPVVIGARFVAVTGRLQNEQGVVHLVAEHLEDMTPLLGKLSTLGAEVHALARADEVKRPQERNKIKVDATPLLPLLDQHSDQENSDQGEWRKTMRAMPRGRNFH